MIVYFLTKEKNVCEAIALELNRNGCKSSIFTDFEKFDSELKKKKNSEIDLLAIDYRFFDPTYIDLYKMNIEKKIFIPMIFYNDPIPEPEERNVFWEVQLRDRFGDYISVESLSRLNSLFTILQETVNSPALNPYISIINRPLELEEKISPDEFDIEQFKILNHIQNARYKLLSFLYQNKGKSISEEKICCYLWNEYSEKRVKTLYTYIHDLRSIFKHERKSGLQITHDEKLCYCFKINGCINK